MGDFWNIFFEEEGSENTSPPSPFANIFFSDEAPGGSPWNPQSAPSAIQFNDDLIFWALRNLPVDDATKHFLVCGTVGSGKTTLINLFLQSIAPRFQSGRLQPEQLIIFDAKCDIVPTLAGLGYEPDDPNVWLMNPFDTRSAIWNLAEAVQEPAMARYLATLLVPEEKNTTAPYFSNAAREIVYAVIVALNTRNENTWTFRDLLCALDSPDHIKGVTKHDGHASRHARQFTSDKKHFRGVLSTLATKLGPFTQVAALWHTHPNPRTFSIKEFLKKPGVLVLGYDPVLNDSLWPINAILLKALTNEILRLPETRKPRHWFVLDEFRAMEKVDCMVDLLNRGRSKGASVLLGLQGVEGMMKVYESAGANEILSLCGHKTFIRVGGPETAKWAEEFFNKVRTTEHVVTEQWSTTGYSHSVQYQVQDRPLFLASMFLTLPYPEKGWLSCINDIPHLNAATIARRPFDQVTSWKKPSSNVEAICRRSDVLDQKIKPWSETEEREFCLPDDEDDAKGFDKEGPEKKKRVKSPLPTRRNNAEKKDNPPPETPDPKGPDMSTG